MKIGIYNEHLRTMGGGEKHMGALAEYLSKKEGNEVDLITSKSVDLDVLAKKLRIDFGNCKLVVMDQKAIEIEELSRQYDLFINSTYLSTIKPQAKRNVLLMFFPNMPFSRVLAGSKKFKAFISLIDKLDVVKYRSGFYQREKIGKYFKRKFGRWTDGDFSFAIVDQGNRRINVHLELLRIGTLEPEEILEAIKCNGEKVAFEVKEDVITFSVISQPNENIVAINLKETARQGSKERNVGIFVENICINSGVLSGMRNLLLKTLQGFRHYDYLKYYDLIMANSQYTRKWLMAMWGVDSKVLYPLVEVEEFFNQELKQKRIISVGRFFVGNHNKKHIPMIRAFKAMYDKGLLDGWEYDLCGGTHPEPVNQRYLEEIKKEAAGYPINIHPDISFGDLKKLYAKSMVFWHAAGFNENERKNPDKFEHFGITTVEAMAAGCIPVVIGKAGQVEIVSEGENGFLWESILELENKMNALLNLPDESRQLICAAATRRAKDFSRDKFFSKLDAALKPLLEDVQEE